ncbi:MAG: glycosyl hydrolase family 18 protein [Lachnospiraceae bacterium]|nr:glycosyl hydrolase family 18 protein [Lachnospiraceae bacterium]
MIYVVKRGDSVFSISQQYGISMEQIMYDNQLYGQRHLVVGQALFLAEENGESVCSSLFTAGYAYPFINSELLREVLVSIDRLLVFSYGFTMGGELIAPLADDLPLIEQAWNAEVVPFLVLTPFGADGRFNNNLISQLVHNVEVQNQLIENLLTLVQERGYGGVDVDFEFILPGDREAFAQFVGRLRERMNTFGYSVSVALAPKVSAGQPGLLYEGIDYRLLGENADQVFLMTYEWGYTYGPPMAIAPINKVREVVSYAVTEIPVGKILMGIPNYAYDWPLPFIQGVTAAKILGNVEAVHLAAEKNAEILFDKTAMSPYFFYWEEGIQHVVWFEDVRSIEAKLNLAKEYSLLGVGYWNLMRPFRANWKLLGNC